MKLRINYTIGKHEDSFIVEGETIEEIRDLAKKQLADRGTDAKKADAWSEQLS